MIHTVGDSHSKFGWVNVPDTQIHHIGPKLMHTFGKQGPSLINIKSWKISDNDFIVFSFGEIDCRIHVGNQCIKQKVNFKEIIKKLVFNYFEAIKASLEIVKNKKVKPFVYNVPPPCCAKRAGGLGITGTNEERKRYHCYANKLMKTYCEINKIGFFDIYNDYSDQDGMLIRELSDDHVHIKDPIYLIKKANELGMY